MNDLPPKRGVSALELIRSGRVKQRPRYFFMLETGFFSIAAFFAFLALLFLSSFMIFFLRGSGSLLLPAQGLQGSKFFLFSFPWMILVSLLILAVVFEALMWRFPFVYHRPLLYSAAAIVILTFAFGAVISYTPFHASAFEQAQSLPLAGGLYRYYGQAASENINFGSALSPAGLEGKPQLETFGGQILEVKAADEKAAEKIERQVGKSEAVMIFGKKKDSQFEAHGIREIEKEKIPFLHDCRSKSCKNSREK